MVWVDDQEIDDGVDLDRDVVVGDDLLRRHLEGDRAQIDLDQAVDAEGDDQAQPRALQRQQAAQPEEDAAFVLVDDPDRRAQTDQDDENDDAKADQCDYADGSLLANALNRRFSSYGSRIISALRRGKARVFMRMRPAALRTAQPAVGAGLRPGDEVHRPRRRAPASRRRADHPLTWPAKGLRCRTPSRSGSRLR